MAYWNYGYSTRESLRHLTDMIRLKNSYRTKPEEEFDFRGYTKEYFKDNRTEIISFILSFCKNEELRNVMNEMLSVISSENERYSSNIYRFISDCVTRIERRTGRIVKDYNKIFSNGGVVKFSGSLTRKEESKVSPM